MSRHHEDGNGVVRHLAGVRFSPPVPPDHRLALPLQGDQEVPRKADASIFDRLPIVDQGAVGSCTGHATARVASALVLRQTGKVVQLSAMFGYSMTRIEEGTPLTEDSGCVIGDAMEGFVRRGLCREEAWPTIDDGRQLELEPDAAAKADAMEHQGVLVYHAPEHRTIVSAIAWGFGVSVGITCFANMMSEECARSGEIRFPARGERAVGGHNFVLRGWDADKRIGDDVGCYFGDNSWGEEWGAKGESPTRGHFWVPKRYVDAGLIAEAFCVRCVEVPNG